MTTVFSGSEFWIERHTHTDMLHEDGSTDQGDMSLGQGTPGIASRPAVASRGMDGFSLTSCIRNKPCRQLILDFYLPEL